MEWFKRLPDSRAARPGMERLALRKMPAILVLGTLLPALYALLAQWLAPGTEEGIRQVLAIRYAALGLVLFHWMAVLQVSLLCAIVVVMKGHAVVADAYKLPDADAPARRSVR
jgi:hypothetical protein